jgi:DNA-binding beta-propeller fold protein YncE
VTVIDTKKLEVVDNIKTGGTFPNTVVLNKKDGSIYVTNKGQGKRDEPTYVDPAGDVVTHIKF